jgi:hypothetical protein
MIPKRREEIWLEWAVVVVPLLIAPVLWFPRVEWMVLGLIVPAVWVGNYWFKKHFVASTPLNLLLLPLLIMVLVSLYATFDVQHSLAKVAGTLLGVFVFLGLVQFVDRGSRLWLGISGFGLGGVGLALVSLVVTNWDQARKDRLLPDLGQMLPIRFRGLPGLEGGFNPNPIGGTLVLFIPLLLLLSVYLLRTILPARWASSLSPPPVTCRLTKPLPHFWESVPLPHSFFLGPLCFSLTREVRGWDSRWPWAFCCLSISVGSGGGRWL